LDKFCQITIKDVTVIFHLLREVNTPNRSENPRSGIEGPSGCGSWNADVELGSALDRLHRARVARAGRLVGFGDPSSISPWPLSPHPDSSSLLAGVLCVLDEFWVGMQTIAQALASTDRPSFARLLGGAVSFVLLESDSW
jgi:hypothetical protein